ncbi:MAG: YceI family protein [Porticoccaceae bacterium]
MNPFTHFNFAASARSVVFVLCALLSALVIADHPPGHEHKLAGAAKSASVSAGWTIAAGASRLNFVSVKNNAVAEVHRFTGLTGEVSADGSANLQIALASVDTGIAIRDERMRSVLFDTAKFPHATARLKFDPAPVRALAVGESLVITTPVKLGLHGASAELTAKLRVTHLAGGHWLVATEQPIIVDGKAVGLGEGVEALRQLANLQGIATGVPVSLVLMLDGN